MPARQPSDGIDAAVRVRPSPERVLALVESHGLTSACMRWGWLSRETLAKLAVQGRQLRRGRTGEVLARRTTREEQEAVVAEVYRLGSVHAAAAETRTAYTTVLAYLRERGLVDYPRVSNAERGRRAWATRRAQAEAGAPA